MPKKSARRSVAKQSNVRALHTDVRPWEMDPGSELREHWDQRYVRNVRPKTDTQRTFIEALDNYHMVLGPAGTGKTYLDSGRSSRGRRRPADRSEDVVPGSLHLRPLDALSSIQTTKITGRRNDRNRCLRSYVVIDDWSDPARMDDNGRNRPPPSARSARG